MTTATTSYTESDLLAAGWTKISADIYAHPNFGRLERYTDWLWQIPGSRKVSRFKTRGDAFTAILSGKAPRQQKRKDGK